MEPDANFVLIEVLVIVALSGRGTILSRQRPTENAWDVDVHEAGEPEAEHSPAEDEEQDKVGDFGKAEEFGYAAEGVGDAAFGRGSFRINHDCSVFCLARFLKY
jgi:hypothetical protein